MKVVFVKLSKTLKHQQVFSYLKRPHVLKIEVLALKSKWKVSSENVQEHLLSYQSL